MATVGALAVGCNGNNDDGPDPGQRVDSCGSNTGRLSVQVKRAETGAMESDAEIFVYVSHDDLLANRYLSYAITGSQGTFDFGCYNYGNYYVRAQKTIGGLVYVGEEVIQVQAGRQFTLPLEIYQP